MIKTVVDYCTSSGDSVTKMKNGDNNDKDVINEDLPRRELFELSNQHKLHLQFLKENDMCSDED